MKIDGGISTDLRSVPQQAKDVEAAGYSGAWTAETSHDPFLPLLLAAEHTETLELGTSIAVAFARNPMTLANTAWDLQAYSRAGSSSASAARSSPTSPSGSRWSGASRRRACARWSWRCGRSGTPG
jgi:hypothetical protein